MFFVLDELKMNDESVGGIEAECRGQNLALAVLYVPHSIDSERTGVSHLQESASPYDPTVGLCVGS